MSRIEPERVEQWLAADLACPHFPWASGDDYWSTAQASTVNPEALAWEDHYDLL